ncbi:MAG: HAMP domain-containing sensor histidine kinase [Bacteroidota bacterium]
MKFWLLRRNSFFYLILAAFVVMVFVEWPLLNSAYKGKEKDFNDKLFLVAPFIQETLVKDTVAMNALTSDSAVIDFVRTHLTKQADSFFVQNNIPVGYVYAVGKLADTKEYYNGKSRFRINPNLIWSSDPSENKGLADTRLAVSHIGPKNADVYYVKIFLPSKPAFLFKQLLPLVILSGISILLLFVCFLILISIIRKQSALALAKEDFINNMTHELKTPLFTISIASKMLAAQEPIRQNEKYVSYIESIQEETARLTQLVDKVLETSALDTEQMQLDKKQVDLHLAIRAAVKSFDLIRKEQGASIEFYPTALIHMINGDETHINAAIRSLLDNAFKYSKEPAQITITTTNQGKNIQLSIADKGIGIDLETKHQLFDRFFRGHTGNLHDVKGYGIGLSYVKAIVEAHGGSISVKSKVGEGSEFILILPYSYGDR